MNDTPTQPSLLVREIERNWGQLTLVAWAVIATWFIVQRWPSIHWLSLGDTDDNMRLMQVRALLAGQGWYDLRQYRLDPPGGFNIHWSRIVDMPIAALILGFRPFMGTAMAERLACGIAPLLPLSLTLIGLSATLRRLVSPLAWPLGIVFAVGCTATMTMFMPERIDHHGWQLASLSVALAGLCDPKARRGGALVGAASAFSLAIGLEMLPYAAGAGAIMALRWVWDRAEAARIQAYGLSLGLGSLIGYGAFASHDNAALRCDALTPVWLSVMVAAGALLVALATVNPAARTARLAGAAVAAVVIAAGFASLFPQCLGRPEQVSPELAREWLANVREAKPIYTHPWRTALPVAVLPIIGIIGAALATWRTRAPEQRVGWAAVLLFTLFAGGMLLWQARAGAAAQLLAVPGAVALAWIILPWCLNSGAVLVRVFGTVAAFLAVSGLFAGLVLKALPAERPDAKSVAVRRASARCPTIPSLAPLDRLPAQTVFTFVDLGPRLITITHHRAVAGPYHRNGGAILDVQHAFKGSAANFRAIARRHGATLLLICPNLAESTLYRASAPGGFYDQLAHNQAPDFLTPLPLPKGSPLRLWRIN